jgi:oxygen-independent coproporphyrinogen-3 oxidase
MAHMYLRVDELANAAGLPWYELSNWGRPAEHNLVYWRNENWWGLGPGAHSHVDGVRWWNVKHPSKYQEKLVNFESPMQDREVLGDSEKRDEKIMLQIRLREGIALSDLNENQLKVLGNYPEQVETIENHMVLTPAGRLIADRIVRELIMA